MKILRCVSVTASVIMLAALYQGCSSKTTPASADKNIFLAEFRYQSSPSGYASTQDAQITDAGTGNNYGACSAMTVGNYLGSKYRGIIYFDVSSLPANVKVDQAELTLKPNSISNAVTITAYALTDGAAFGGFLEGPGDCSGSAGYTSWSWYTAPGGDFNQSTPASNTIQREMNGPDALSMCRFELNASMVQDWIKTPYKNFGIIISSGSEANPGDYLSFYTKEAAGDSNILPELAVYYELQ